MLKVEWMQLGSIATNCYFLINEETKETIVVDPADQADKIRRKAAQEGLDLQAVFLTHGHGDHILAVNDLKSDPGVTVYACEAEAPLLADPGQNLSMALFGKSVSVKADVWLKGGEEFQAAGMKWKLLHTPGHTKGGCCYYQEEAGVLMSGDTLFRCSVGRTDFPGGSMAEILTSIEDKLLVLPETTLVYPGHDRSTEIGYEKKFNPYIRGTF